MSYETYRDINGWLSLVCAVLLLTMGAWLLWRGEHERPWWRPIPGRLIVGAFLVAYAALQIENAAWRIASTGAGTVGRHVNDANTVIGFVVAAVLGVWSMLRFVRNDLERDA